MDVCLCVCVCVGRGSDTGAEGHLLRFLEAVSHCLSASWPSLAGTLAWWVVRIIAAPWLLAVTYHQQATLALGPGLTAGVRGRLSNLAGFPLLARGFPSPVCKQA